MASQVKAVPSDSQVRSILQNHGFVRVDGLQYKSPTGDNGQIIDHAEHYADAGKVLTPIGVWNTVRDVTVVVTMFEETWLRCEPEQPEEDPTWTRATPNGQADIAVPLSSGEELSSYELMKRKANLDWQPSVAGRDAT